jgi:dihydrofolate reductase
MADTTCHMSISLDGFVAGPDQSREHPLGKRGRELHDWHLGDERANEADATAERRLLRPRGAYVMGRNMFGPIRGEWDEEWSGWWGPEPPYHAPVFVLTHHSHAPIEMEGGTTFHFVTDGFDAAYAQAREIAGADGMTSRAAPRPSAKRCSRASSTSSGSTSSPFYSVPARGYSPA